MPNFSNMEITDRDKIESLLISNFSGSIRPITSEEVPLINLYKDGSFGRSYFMLYANGYNLRGKSNHFPKGLLYYDGDNIFGIGYFKKAMADSTGHLSSFARPVLSFILAIAHHTL